MGSTAAKSKDKLNVHLSDAAAVRALKVVLRYEAAMRGRSMGQAAYELVLESVDTSTYPDEVQARLAEIAAENERRAIAKSLSLSAFDTREP